MTMSTNIHVGDAGVTRLGGLATVLTGGSHFAPRLPSTAVRVQGRNRPWVDSSVDPSVPAVFGTIAGRTPASGVAVRVAGMMQPR